MDLSPAERQRRSDLAKRLHRDGRFGGRQPARKSAEVRARQASELRSTSYRRTRPRSRGRCERSCAMGEPEAQGDRGAAEGGAVGRAPRRGGTQDRERAHGPPAAHRHAGPTSSPQTPPDHCWPATWPSATGSSRAMPSRSAPLNNTDPQPAPSVPKGAQFIAKARGAVAPLTSHVYATDRRANHGLEPQLGSLRAVSEHATNMLRGADPMPFLSGVMRGWRGQVFFCLRQMRGPWACDE